jgi:hypothetical protein
MIIPPRPLFLQAIILAQPHIIVLYFCWRVLHNHNHHLDAWVVMMGSTWVKTISDGIIWKSQFQLFGVTQI